MNDVITVIGLLSKTSQDFTKKTIQMSGGTNLVEITLTNGVQFVFDKDDNLSYITTKTI